LVNVERKQLLKNANKIKVWGWSRGVTIQNLGGKMFLADGIKICSIP